MAGKTTSGAATGAMIGSLAGSPLLGAAIGGGTGLLADVLGIGSNHDAVQNALSSLDESKGIIENNKTQNTALANNSYNALTGLWDSDGTLSSKYSEALQNLESVDPYEASEFDYDKSIKDFYDPAFQLSVNMANDAINNSQATGGNMFSSDTANKLAAKNQVLATQMYDDAVDAMNQDKSLEQSIWQGNESAKQAAASSAANVANNKLSAYGTGMSNLSSAMQDYYDDLMNINSDYSGDYLNYLGTKASLEAQDDGGGLLDWLF